MLNGKKYFFFDFDGTLVDSVNLKAKILVDIFKNISEADKKAIYDFDIANKGLSRYEKINYVLKNILSDESIKLDNSYYASKYSKLLVKRIINVREIKGAEEFLIKLKAKNNKLFLITATPDEDINKILVKKNWFHLFDNIKGSSNGNKIFNLNQIINEFEIKSKKSIFFGDSTEDYNCAINFKIDFVLVGNKDLLVNFQKCHIINNFKEILF